MLTRPQNGGHNRQIPHFRSTLTIFQADEDDMTRQKRAGLGVPGWLAGALALALVCLPLAAQPLPQSQLRAAPRLPDPEPRLPEPGGYVLPPLQVGPRSTRGPQTYGTRALPPPGETLPRETQLPPPREA